MIIGIISVKEKSTILPNKNMINLKGRPLIDYTFYY